MVRTVGSGQYADGSQLTFGDAEYAGKRKKTRREVFLEEMDQAVPWTSLLSLIEPFYPVAGRGRHPYPLETMLQRLGVDKDVRTHLSSHGRKVGVQGRYYERYHYLGDYALDNTARTAMLAA